MVMVVPLIPLRRPTDVVNADVGICLHVRHFGLTKLVDCILHHQAVANIVLCVSIQQPPTEIATQAVDG